ncbi:MAG TPA: phosphotransferase [Acidimicrobiia bacterium]
MTVAAALGPPATPDEEPVHGTVAELIGGADLDEAQAAAKCAHAHAFVLELPQGYDTLVGDDGTPLSPSQLRRLELARRLVVDPTTVIDPVGLAPPLPPDDPGLPGFGQLLDTGAMAPILARALEVEVPPKVRVRSVRYKPGKNAVVHYDVGTGDEWLEAIMYATSLPDTLGDKATKPTRAARAARLGEHRPATPSPLSFELEAGALLQWLPLDIRLKGLAKGGAKLARRLADAGLAVEEGTEPVLLRYWARRRAVLGFGDHVIKLYRDPLDFAAAERGLRAASDLVGVRTAPFEAVLPSLKATVQRQVQGCAPRLRPAGGEPVGAFLAQLHGAALPAPDAVDTSDTDDLLAKAATRAQFVAELVPGLAPDVSSLLADLEARRPRELPFVTSHGNFHAGQLLDTGDGLVMIDVDRLCRSHRGYDVASYATHLAFGRSGVPDEMEVVATAVGSVVEGYGACPDALGWFIAICLLRRAPVPFRYLDERWPDATAALVRSARQALDQ